CFFADIGAGPVGVDVATRQFGRPRVMFSQLADNQFTAGSILLHVDELFEDFLIGYVLIGFSAARIDEAGVCQFGVRCESLAGVVHIPAGRVVLLSHPESSPVLKSWRLNPGDLLDPGAVESVRWLIAAPRNRGTEEFWQPQRVR